MGGYFNKTCMYITRIKRNKGFRVLPQQVHRNTKMSHAMFAWAIPSLDWQTLFDTLIENVALVPCHGVFSTWPCAPSPFLHPSLLLINSTLHSPCFIFFPCFMLSPPRLNYHFSSHIPSFLLRFYLRPSFPVRFSEGFPKAE